MKTLIIKTVRGASTVDLSALRECFQAPEPWQRGQRRGWKDSKENRDGPSRNRKQLWPGAQPQADSLQAASEDATPTVQVSFQRWCFLFISFICSLAFEQLPSHTDSAYKMWLPKPTNLQWGGCEGSKTLPWSVTNTRMHVPSFWNQSCHSTFASRRTNHFPLVPAETFLSCFLLLETGGESIGFAYLQFCWFVTFL